MATSNVAAMKDNAILVNNAPQQEQQEVNGDKEVPESSGNSNPTASTKVFTNDSFVLTSSSTVETEVPTVMETEVPTVSTHVPTDSLYVPLVTSSIPRIISKGGSSFLEPLSLGNAMSFENRLEDFFGDTSNVVSLNEVEADLSNMETAIQVCPTPTLRIHKDHPKSQIIGHVDTPVETRQKTKNVDEQSFIATIHQKANLDLLQYCLFSCFLSQEEPKKIVDALKDPSWVLKNKRDERGIIIRNKARLVAQGHTQEEGLTMKKPNVDNVPNSDNLIKIGYEGYWALQYTKYHEFPHRVYKVEKAVYGLHQAPRAWYGTLSKYLLDYGFQRGLQVLQMKDGIFLSQDKYVGDILKKFRYTDIKTEKTPIDRENPWRKDGTSKDVELHLYRSMIGSLMYLRADETTFPTRDVRYGEDFPTVTHLDAGQDKENIAKTSVMPYEALPRVTTLGYGEGIQMKWLMFWVLWELQRTLASGGLRSVFTTASLPVAIASIGVSPAAATASGSFPTAVIFTTASVATPTTRVKRSSKGVVIRSSYLISVNIPSISKKDKGKGKMTEPKQPSKEKVLKQMSVQLARDLEAKFAQEYQIIKEQAKRDFEIAMIHAERELKIMIAELDRNNEMVAKYLNEYEQVKVGLSNDEKVELIDELLVYQRHLAQIKKYQAQ
nr:hypothetical protein [Tanacetum cinerariifolium]